MKGETFFDIVDTGDNSRIKYQKMGGEPTRWLVDNRKPLARAKAVRQTTGRPQKEKELPGRTKDGANRPYRYVYIH